MADNFPKADPSRRWLIKSGGILLAGSLVGCDSVNTSRSAQTPPELPWHWSRIDPMEAGSRAFRAYHEKGG